MGHSNNRLVEKVRRDLALGNFNATKMAILLSYNDHEVVRDNIGLMLQAYYDSNQTITLRSMAADLAFTDGVSANVCLAVQGVLPWLCPKLDCLQQLGPLLDSSTLRREFDRYPAYARQLVPTIKKLKQYLSEGRFSLAPQLSIVLERLNLRSLPPAGESIDARLLQITLDTVLPNHPAEDRCALVDRLFNGPSLADGKPGIYKFLPQLLMQHMSGQNKQLMANLYELIPKEHHSQLSENLIELAYAYHDHLQDSNPYYLAKLFSLMPSRELQKLLVTRFSSEDGAVRSGNFLRSFAEYRWQRKAVRVGKIVNSEVEAICSEVKAEHNRLADADGFLHDSSELAARLEEYGFGLAVTDFYVQPTDPNRRDYCDLRDQVFVHKVFYDHVRQHLAQWNPGLLLSIDHDVKTMVDEFRALVTELSTRNGMRNNGENADRLKQFLCSGDWMSDTGADEVLDLVFEPARMRASDMLVLRSLPDMQANLHYKIIATLAAAGSVLPPEQRGSDFNAMLAYLLTADTGSMSFKQARQSYFEMLRKDDGLALIFSAIKYISDKQVNIPQLHRLQVKTDRLFCCDPETDESFITRVGANVFLGPEWIAGIRYIPRKQVQQQMAQGADAVETFRSVDASASLAEDLARNQSGSNDFFPKVLQCLPWRRGAGRTFLALVYVSPSRDEREIGAFLDYLCPDPAKLLANQMLLDYPGSFGSLIYRMLKDRRPGTIDKPLSEVVASIEHDVETAGDRLRQVLSLVDAGLSVAACELFATDSSYLQALIEPSCLRLAKQTLAACAPEPLQQQYVYSLIAKSSLNPDDKDRLGQFLLRCFPGIDDAQEDSLQDDTRVESDGCSYSSAPAANAGDGAPFVRSAQAWSESCACADADVSQYDDVVMP